jgi:hypothetical protein
VSYRVFVSSTYLDNKERRKIVEDAIIRAGMTPVGMERFAASTNPARDECVRLAEECDLLVGIIAYRYGWEPEGETRSITEIEYDAASERLMFLVDSSAVPMNPDADCDPLPSRWDCQKKLDLFKERIDGDQMPARFDNDNLGTSVLHALIKWKARREGGETTADPAAIPAYLKAIDSLHGTLRLAGFETKLRVPILFGRRVSPTSATPRTRRRNSPASAATGRSLSPMRSSLPRDSRSGRAWSFWGIRDRAKRPISSDSCSGSCGAGRRPSACPKTWCPCSFPCGTWLISNRGSTHSSSTSWPARTCTFPKTSAASSSSAAIS